MRLVSLAEARKQLAALIHAAEAGEHIVITRHRKPVAELGPVMERKSVDLRSSIEQLRRDLAHIPESGQGGADLVRAMRDEDVH